MENDNSIIGIFIAKTQESVCYLNVSEQIMRSITLSPVAGFELVDLKSEVSPLRPFLLLLKNCSPSDNDIEQFVYSLHQPFFRQYLKGESCDDRHDIIIEQEYFYEKTRIRQSIIALLEKLNTKRYIFTNAQYMLAESLEIVRDLEKSAAKDKFVFCFDSMNTNLFSEDMQNFIDTVSKQRNFLNIPVTNLEIQFSQKLQNQQDGFQLSFAFSRLATFEEIFGALRNYRLFLSFEEEKSVVQWLSEHIQNASFSPDQKRRIYLEMGIICYDNDNLDQAALYFNNIIDFQIADLTEQKALLYLAKIFAKRKSNHVAQKYVAVLRNKLGEDTSSWLYAQTVNTEYLISERSKEDDLAKYTEVVQVLKASGLVNSYVATSLNIPWTLIKSPEYQDMLQSQLDESMRCAEQLDNQHLISSIFHRKAIILSHYGKTEEAFRLSMECNRIRTEIGELQPILAIRNGLSYEALCRANYTEAYNYINEIIGKLYTVSDYCTIIDSLKNIAYAIFYSRHFTLADELFSLMVYLIKSFDLANSANNSFLPSLSDLLIYRSLICIENMDFVHAQMNYISVTTSSLLISEVDKPLLHYIRAAVLADSGKLSQSFDEFDKTITEIDKNCGNQVHKKVFACYGFANVLKKLGHDADSRRYFEQGFACAAAASLSYYTKGKQSLTLEEFYAEVEPLEPLGCSLEFLHEKAEKDRLMNQLHRKLYDYQFLNKIKSVNGAGGSIKKYLEATISIIMEYTGASQITVSENNESPAWKKIVEQNNGKSRKIPVHLWDQYFLQTENDNQVLWDGENELYYANLSKFDFRFAIIIIPENAESLSPDSLNILNLALSTMLSQIIMFKQNENLFFLSTTDQLSMLKNRHALQEFINMESGRLARYKARKKVVIQEIIAFIDLDNFKFYNDTYGHLAGDILIQCFSALLKEVLRKTDFICRFGGDEFVIVMSDTDSKEAAIVISRLRDALDRCEHFIPVLKERLNMLDLYVPDNKKLDFSVGLCSNTDLSNDCDLNDVMRNADVALYYSKEHGKKMTTCYAEMR